VIHLQASQQRLNLQDYEVFYLISMYAIQHSLDTAQYLNETIAANFREFPPAFSFFCFNAA